MDNNQSSVGASRIGDQRAENAEPTPWKVFTNADGTKLVGIGSVNGLGVCDAGFGVWRWNDAEGIANAELIVRAVNSHADMLAALKALLGQCDQGCQFHEITIKSPSAQQAMTAARAAISKATGAAS